MSASQQEIDTLIGETIGGCEVVEKIGQGGMGVVYKGVNQVLDRHVAIKILREVPMEDSETYIKRFLQEARTAARLLHPNIVQIFDAGEYEDSHYITMEFIEGESVKDLIRRKKRVELPKAIDIMKQVSNGLSLAEEKKIVHRDIKPANILLDRGGTAKIADFGLAKNVEANMNLTLAGQVVGTAFFMSPEQCDAEATDTRSDIYSLGATFYQTVAGRYPFIGETPLSVMLKHKIEPLAPPRLYNANVPEPVCNVISKMMAKQPEDRYQTVAELIEDLERLEAGEEPAASKSLPKRARAQVQKAKAILSVVKGRTKGRTFTFEEGKSARIGRDSTKNEIAVLDGMISRAHCTVKHEGAKCVLTDVGSANGTYVGGQKIQTHTLAQGDRFKAGNTEFLFRMMPRAKDAAQFAEIAYEKRIVRPEHLDECLHQLALLEQEGKERPLGELLLERGYVDADGIKRAQNYLNQKVRNVLVTIVPTKTVTPSRVEAEASDAGSESDAIISEAERIAIETAVSEGAMTQPKAEVHVAITEAKSEGLFDDLTFCDKCGEYIDDEAIESGIIRHIGSHLFCRNCMTTNPHLGEQLGRYTLWETLGRGRFGTVYRAEESDSQRVVAVKVIDKKLVANGTWLNNFIQAVEATKGLRHRHVIETLDVQQTAPNCAVVMEYGGPRSVRDYLTPKTKEEEEAERLRTPFDLDKCLDIITQAARGLEFVYQKKLVHGELGPEKLVIGVEGSVRLADVGVQGFRVLEGTQPDGIRPVAFPVSFRECMSPEAKTHINSIDIRSDIYSLGAILYAMLTGRVSTPSDYDPQSFLQSFPESTPMPVREVVGRTMAPLAKDRYKTPKQLLRVLRSL